MDMEGEPGSEEMGSSGTESCRQKREGSLRPHRLEDSESEE